LKVIKESLNESEEEARKLGLQVIENLTKEGGIHTNN